jgi:hypothetical protein
MKKLSGLLLMVCVAAACGGGGDPFGDLANETDFGSPVSDPSSGAAATNTVESATQLAALVSSGMADENSVGFLANAYSGPLEMLGPAVGNAPLARIRQALENDRANATFPDCVEVGETYVQFNDCEETDEFGSATLNGRIEFVDGTLSVDIEMTGSYSEDGAELTMSLSIHGDITVTETSIVGRMDFNVDLRVSFDGQSGRVSMVSAVIYDVGLTDECPTSGDIKVGVRVSVSGGGESETVEAVGRAEFGPACGDVTVSARATSE